MLPDNTLSSTTIYAPFFAPVATKRLVDYELGGVALNDPSGGLSTQLWTARYVGGQIVVSDSTNTPAFTLTVAGVTKLSLAFDSNMKPTIAYETAAGGFLYWFDTFVNDNVTTAFPDVRNPAVTLDERRQVLLNNADVIFAYQKADGGLYYRQQRDRFATERLLQADTGDAKLLAVGMNQQWRLQFKFSGFVPQPVYVPPPPPPTDPHEANVVSHVHFDGENGSKIIIDGGGKVWTLFGDAALSTAQSAFGGSSLGLGGTGYAMTPDHADFNFGSEDFTIELWGRPAALTGAGQYPALLAQSVGDTTNCAFTLMLNQNNSGLVFQYTTNGSTQLYASNAVPLVLGAQNHFAISRVGPMLYVCTNGVTTATNIGTAAIFNSTASMVIGRHGTSQTGNFWNGHVDEMRITKGVGRYSGDFIPPNAPFLDKTVPAARYWRVNILSNEASDVYMNIDRLTLRETAEGPSLGALHAAVGIGTESTKYGAQYGAEGAFEDNGFWHSANEPAPWWAAYDFGEGNPQAVGSISIRGANYAGRQPKNFEIQYATTGMHEGADWKTVAGIGGATGWVLGVPKDFTWFTPT